MKCKCFIICLSLLTCLIYCHNPKISIITSMYNGDEFIEGFLADITRQTVFDQCELILINADSPGSEELTIKKYMEKFPNIIYKKLDHDPGIYAVWNYAINMSRGKYITNANLDDRLSPNCYEVFMHELDKHPEVMLVYSEFYLTNKPNETFEMHSGYRVQVPNFSRKNMHICLPGCNPMWRRSLHAKFGFFDESYKSSGDYEMWLRAVDGGAIFKKVAGCYGLYYKNPQGISTSSTSCKYKEDQKIIKRYRHVWTRDIYNKYYKLARKLDKMSCGNQRAWSLALYYYLMAFTIRHDYAEPLVRIAQRYYKEGDMALSYIFAERACELPEPEQIDKEQSELYHYTRFDLLGIVAWYVGEFDVGEYAVKRALEFAPDEKRLHSNLCFYTDRK